MTDFELTSKLKSVPVPERSEEYWDDFPSRIRLQLHQRQAVSPPVRVLRSRLSLTGSFALVVVTIFLCVRYHPFQGAFTAITSHERHVHAELARLDTGLHRLMLNTDGMGYLLTDVN